MRRPVVILLLLTAGLTGCLQGGEDDPLREAGGTDGPANASANGSSSVTNASEAPTNRTDRTNSSATTVERSFTWQGTTGTWAFVCAVAACTPPFALGGDSVHNQSVTGNLQSIDITVTWDPVTPLMDELNATVRADCGDDCDESGEAEGSSPLELSLQAPDDAEPWFHVTIRPPVREFPQGWTWTSHDQPFTVEGTYTAVQEGAP